MDTVRVKEETPTKIVLEIGPWPPQKRSENLGCLFPPLVVAIILAIGLVYAFSYLYASLSWLFWVIATIVLIISFYLIRFMFSILKDYLKFDEDKVALEETVIVDFDFQRATRIEKMQSGKTRQTDLDLKQVSRVRIQMEEHGHHHRLYIESPTSEPFQVSIAFTTGAYGGEELIAHGKKIGKLLIKPVIFQHTDLGNLISEEVMQS